MQYPNYTFKSSDDIYIKRKKSLIGQTFMKNFGCAIAITFSTYYIICLYRDYLNSLPYWNKLRQDKIIAKESYEFVVQGFHPIRKTLIQQFSQF